MNEDYTVLSIYLTLGIPLMISYYLLATKSTKVIDQFWSNNGKIKWLKNHDSIGRKVYMLSMIIAAISGIYMFYYFTWGNITQEQIFGLEYEQGKYFIYVGFLLLLGFSLLWIPAFCLTNLSTIVLLIIGTGAILIMASLASTSLQTNENKVALAAAVYMAFHTCVLDGILWTKLII